MINPQIFLLHFAGGSCFSFQFLQPYLSGWDFLPLELPGRGKRMHERLLTDFDLASADLCRQIVALRTSPFLIYGHSMGAILALKVTAMLEAINIHPLKIVVSGNPGPGIRDDLKKHTLDKERLKSALKEIGGGTPDFFANDELFSFFEPIFRADFEMVEKHPIELLLPVSAPIHALMGDQEEFSNRIQNWKDFTLSHFDHEILEGGHFFIYQHAEMISNIIRRCQKESILF